jgi:hypothetical protein
MIAVVQDEIARFWQAMEEEKKRHNQQKEAAGLRRTEQREHSLALSNPQKKQKYDMMLYKCYRQLKADGMADDKIITFFPDMKKYTSLD